MSRAIFSTTLDTRGWIYTAVADAFVVGGSNPPERVNVSGWREILQLDA